MKWTIGKGVIGRAWATQSPQHESFGEAMRDWRNAKRDTDPLAIGEHPGGLDDHEYEMTIEKYYEILAVPIVTENGRIIGVFSMDVVASESRRDTGPRLNIESIRKVMSVTASMFRDQLGN